MNIQLPASNILLLKAGTYDSQQVLDWLNSRYENAPSDEHRATIGRQIRYAKNLELLSMPIPEQAAKIRRARNYRAHHYPHRPDDPGYAKPEELVNGWAPVVDDTRDWQHYLMQTRGRAKKAAPQPAKIGYGTVVFENMKLKGLIYDIDEYGIGEFYDINSNMRFLVEVISERDSTWRAVDTL